MKVGSTADLLASGAIIKPSFCGPCFGAGDVPANNGLSLRHTTRNFPNREGSKPAEGQFAAVCLMDARSIAATAANGGRITPATDLDYTPVHHEYHFDDTVYKNRVYYGFGKADPAVELHMGPNITDWPKMYALSENLLVELAAVLHDPVTTTDELIPSGETSSYRSNPLRLAEFTLSRRVPEYVGRSKAVAEGKGPRRGGRPVPCKSLPWIRWATATALAEDHPVRLCRLCQQARRRLRPGAGSLLPEGSGRLCQYLLPIRHQALSQQLHQLGHPALHHR